MAAEWEALVGRCGPEPVETACAAMLAELGVTGRMPNVFTADTLDEFCHGLAGRSTTRSLQQAAAAWNTDYDPRRHTKAAALAKMILTKAPTL